MSAQINGTIHGMNGGLVILRDIIVPGLNGSGAAACGEGLTGGRCSPLLRIVSRDVDELLELGD